MRKVILIILGILIAAGAGWYFYAKSRQGEDGMPSITDFSSFFPTGDNSGDPIDGVLSTIPDPQTQPDTTVSSAFKQVSPHPIAGYDIFTQSLTVTIPPDPTISNAKPTTQTILKHITRYISRGNGYVYEIEDESVPLQVSNVYIPNIYEATLGDRYSTALLRFLRADQRTIATYSVPIPPLNTDGTRTQKEGVYFPDNITSMTLSPDGTQVARITTDPNGALLRITSTTNTKGVDIVRTPFREWIISWPTAKSIYLQTKASARVPGYLYRVDTTEKKLRRVIGNIDGLTASVSPTGTFILYSQHSDNAFVTKLLNTKTNTTRTLNLALLPEKCAWLKNDDLICAGNTSVPEAEYPDAWYDGTITFSDQLYRIYTASTTYDTLYDNMSASFDMTSLTVDESREKIYFIDKPTGLLWSMEY